MGRILDYYFRVMMFLFAIASVGMIAYAIPVTLGPYGPRSRSPGNNYKAAMQAHYGNAVVLLTTEGCPPCQRLKNNLMIAMDRAGILEDSSIVVISVQKQKELAFRLHGNTRQGFPMIIVFRQGKVYRGISYTNQATLVAWLESIRQFDQKYPRAD